MQVAVRLQIRNDTASNWQQHNPILAVGELAIETDTRKFKIGNGNQAWNDLPYATQGETGLPGPTGKSIQYIWSGTQLGIRVEGESTYHYVDLIGPKGDKGDTGSIDNLEAFHISDALGYEPAGNKDIVDKFTETDGQLLYNNEEIGGAVPNLTLNELTLGGRFKIVYNDIEDSLDIEVI